jgi:hypothetical protein
MGQDEVFGRHSILTSLSLLRTQYTATAALRHRLCPWLCLAKTRSTFEINKMQKRLCNMLHVPCGSRNGPGRGFR